MKQVITISQHCLNDMESIAKILEKDGLKINHKFQFGVFIGEADEETIEKMKQHKEVVDVKPESISHAMF